MCVVVCYQPPHPPATTPLRLPPTVPQGQSKAKDSPALHGPSPWLKTPMEKFREVGDLESGRVPPGQPVVVSSTFDGFGA